ncbi:MAG TPA: 2-amino-4-hydroxy-6-hydroxymethyldihydropteridine diphosphokinase [Hyphomicrobiaceae bacterium]|nr:2-amino-4-hydroxy-6-hydroxymethyldihydropteridine diphosphokinase [Hyphomicrobiaceae bacterium]
MGANTPGPWGPPEVTLRRAIVAGLPGAGFEVIEMSSFYETAPIGAAAAPRGPRYVNTVVVARARYAPARALSLLKRMERAAGRRSRGPGAPRPLDIDIVDFGGRITGWPPSARRPKLVLPHPEMHRRAFVLVPLAEVWPHWHHPCFGVSALTLLRRLARRPGDATRLLASHKVSCQENTKGPKAG